jgi:1-acyl-sn-glycerol-3-phosphate acyltransferase
MFNTLARFIFKFLGWQIDGALPANIYKCVFVVAPHYSWKDFFVGLGTRAMLRIPIGYLGKKELFDKPLLGWFFHKTGGTPVDRFSKNGMVADVAAVFASKKSWYLSMAPEGTRQNVPKLRSGFYHIAMAAGVPLVFVGFDLHNKTVKIAKEGFVPTGNYEADLKHIARFFKKIEPNKDWIARVLD